MVCTITSTKKPNQGFTLVEVLITLLISSMILITILSVGFYSARSFAALTNYVDLDNHSRRALDVMTREIRQADYLVSGTDKELTFHFTDPSTKATYTVRYVYSPEARTLVRIKGDDHSVLLDECDFLRFRQFQRNTISGTYDQYTASDASTCKLVQMSWVCSRKILGAKANTESVQSAKVVLRKM